MSEHSNHPFNHRRGPVFAVDGAGGSSSPTSASAPLSGMSDATSQYEGMFNQNMADQLGLYGKANDLNKQSNTMKTIMDIGVKVSKAVQTG